MEGLRAVAILAVVLFHAGVGWATGGFVGVDVFFVISGFLITGLLWGELERTGRIHLTSFYGRRARRLLPASALVIVATVVASYWLLAPLRVEEVAKDAVAAAGYVANYRFAALQTNYLTAHGSLSPLQHYWSLGVEEQFYLCWPLLLLAVSLLGRRARRPSRASAAVALGVVGTASLVASVRLTSSAQPWAFFSLPTRAWELAAGALVALATPWLPRLGPRLAAALGWTGVGAVAWAIASIGASTPFPGTVALVPVAGTAALLAAGTSQPRRGPGWLLSRTGLQAVGRLSYAWYLWHWPVLVLAAAVAGHPLSLGANLALVVASAAAAAVTVGLVERPIRFSPLLARQPRRSLALGAVLTGGALAAGGAVAVLPPVVQPRGHVARPLAAPSHAAGGDAPADVADPGRASLVAATAPITAAVSQADAGPLPSNLTPSLRRAYADRAKPFLDGCHSGFTSSTLSPCVYGNPAGSTTMVGFGDSHATQWFPALQTVAARHGWRYESFSKSTCPPAALPVLWSPDLRRSYPECSAWRRAVVDHVRAERPALVVLMVARHYGPEYRFKIFGPEWTAGLAQTVRDIGATGARVVVLGPVPKPPGDVPECLSAHPDRVTACEASPGDEVSAAGMAAERAAVTAAGGSYLDVTSWFCTVTRCPSVVGNLLVYRDDNHITTAYASWLAPALDAALAR